MRKSTTRISAVIATASILAAAGCSGNEAADQGSNELTVGLIPIVDVAPIYLGIQEGFFEDEGLSIKPVMSSGGAAIVPAVTGGSYQVGFSNNVSLIIAISKGLGLKAIAPGTGISPETESSKAGVGYCSVMSSGKGKVKEIADLDGASLAVNTLNNIGDVTIKDALEKKGVDPSGVDFVEMPFPDMPAAVKGGHVDAAWVCEPFVTSLLDEDAIPLFNNYAELDPNLPVASYFTSSEWAEKNPEDLEAFTKALNKSMEFATDNPGQVRDVITEYTKLDAETADRIGLPNYPTEFNEEGLRKLVDLSHEYDLTKKSITVDEFTGKS